MSEKIGPWEAGAVHLLDELDALRSLPDACLDAIVTDPPFGCTRNAWDKPVHWPAFFDEAWRVLREPAPIVALVNFDVACEMRRAEWPVDHFRYEIVCPHNLPTGHLNARIMPMLAHLFLVVFCRESPPWFPQMEDRPKSHSRRFVKGHARGTTYGAHHDTATDTSLGGWPTTVHPFAGIHASVRDHASEKPVALAEWVLRSYTETSAMVCDPFAGSGWVACATVRTGRRSVGFDSDPASVELATRRIAAEHERLGEVRPDTAKPNQQIGLLTGEEVTP